MGHRCFLPTTHRWHNDKDSFDGTGERRLPLRAIFGSDVLEQMKDLDGMILTKDTQKNVKISHTSRGDNWNKNSIFF